MKIYATASKETALRMVERECVHYTYFPIAIRRDLDVFKAAVANDWRIAYDLPEVVMGDEVMEETYLHCFRAFDSTGLYTMPPAWVHPKFLTDDFILNKALAVNGFLLEYFPHLHTNRTYALAAVRSKGGAFLIVNEHFQDDKEMAMLAFNTYGRMGDAQFKHSLETRVFFMLFEVGKKKLCVFVLLKK